MIFNSQKNVLQITLLTVLTLNSTLIYGLDLRSALYEMTKTDPAIIAKQKELEAARHELSLARSGYFPKVDIQGSYGSERAKSQLTQYQEKSWETYSTGATVTQNLFSGFSTEYDVLTKEKKIKAREYALIEQANDSALRLSKSYLDVLRAHELVLIEAENVKLHERIFKEIKIRVEAGSGRISDFMEVSAKLSLAYSNLLSQDNSYQDTLSNFHRAMGRYEEGKNLIKPDEVTALPEKLEEALSQSLQMNPSLLVSRYEIEAAKSAMRLERHGYMPKLDAALNAKTSENASGLGGTNNSTSALMTLSWNLYNGGSDSARMERAVSEIENAVEKLHLLQREVMEGMGLSFNAYISLNRQKEFLMIYEESNAQKKGYYQEEFDLGRRSLIDLLDAEDEYNTARRKVVQNRYDRLYAQYRILDAKGSLLKHFGLNVSGDKKKVYNLEPDDVEKEHASVICQNSADTRFGINGCTIIPQPQKYEFIDAKAKVVLSENTAVHKIVQNELKSSDSTERSKRDPVSILSTPTVVLSQTSCSATPQYREAMGYLESNTSNDGKLKAFHILSEAARSKDAKAQFALARMYNQGTGIPIDREKAGYWYRESARNGYTPAYLIVWSYYRDGSGGVIQDSKKAEYWRKKAVDSRNTSANNTTEECVESAPVVKTESIQKQNIASPKSKSLERIKPLDERLRELGISLSKETSFLHEPAVLQAPPPLVKKTNTETLRK